MSDQGELFAKTQNGHDKEIYSRTSAENSKVNLKLGSEV